MDSKKLEKGTSLSSITKVPQWTKHVFQGHKKLEQKEKIDEVIEYNYNMELNWDQEQAFQWIENLLDETFPQYQRKLAKLLEDGTILCRMIQIVAPQLLLKKYHEKPTQLSLKIDNINLFLKACDHFNIKTKFEPTDILEDKNLNSVVACLEQFMKINTESWKKATKTVKVTLRDGNGGVAEMTFSETTKVLDVKEKMAQMRQIPESELPHYGIFLTSKTDNQESEIDNEDLWMDENASIIGDFFPVIQKTEANLSFKHMNKQVEKLLKTTTNEQNMKVLIEGSEKKFEKKIDEPTLVAGDQIQLYFHNIAHLHSSYGIIGNLFITKFQLIFISSNPNSHQSQCSKKGFRIPISCVNNIAKCAGLKLLPKEKKIGKFYSFEIRCKDFNDLKFSYLIKNDPSKRTSFIVNPSKINANLANVPLSDLLDEFVYPTVQELFAFYTNPKTAACSKVDGWGLYSIEKEYERLKFSPNKWRISTLNKNYQYSSTYPAHLIIPQNFSDHQLEAVFRFRSKGRIPALVWVHPETQAVLARCAQPSVGLRMKRCPEDELLLETIRTLSGTKVPEKLYIVDARPHLNAVANQMKGLGYEGSGYSNTKIEFVGIENIHVMREALAKFRKILLAEQPDEVVLKKARSSKWLEHVKIVLNGAIRIVNLLHTFGSPVVLHCSDGWDRTSQLCGLAELILDPFYRTLEGFEILIEKEWLSFGHKFDIRIGHTNRNYKDGNRAPIFIQFIDAVWQLVNRYPKAFEFNTYFLRVINNHLFSCCFGTFLFNSEGERLGMIPIRTTFNNVSNEQDEVEEEEEEAPEDESNKKVDLRSSQGSENKKKISTLNSSQSSEQDLRNKPISRTQDNQGTIKLQDEKRKLALLKSSQKDSSSSDHGVHISLTEKTLSLWSHINYHKSNFISPDYQPKNGLLCTQIDFPLQVWEEYYLNWKKFHKD